MVSKDWGRAEKESKIVEQDANHELCADARGKRVGEGAAGVK